MKIIKKIRRKMKKKFAFIKNIKKPNFSKLILFLVLLYIGRVVEFSLNMMKLTYDLAPLAYLLPAIIGVGGSIVNFYYWKAKSENMVKQEQNPNYVQPSIYEGLFENENNNEGEEI